MLKFTTVIIVMNRGKRVVDRHIQRYPGAVSWFSPGSYPLRPRTKVPEITNLACAGDWVVLQDPTKTGGSNTATGGVLPFSLDEVFGKQLLWSLFVRT